MELWVRGKKEEEERRQNELIGSKLEKLPTREMIKPNPGGNKQETGRSSRREKNLKSVSWHRG